MDGSGDRFQQETKYYSDKMGGHKLDWDAKPALYKEYPQAKSIELPSFEPSRPMTLDAVLKQRRSVRDFQAKPISLGQLGHLLWSSTGLQRLEHSYQFRTAPSAGALYPIETYLIVNDVRKIEPGVYHYSIRGHKLEEIGRGDMRRQITGAALGQGMCATAAAVFERCKWKYGQRAYRYIYLDAGHIAENLSLAAVSLNLGSCEIGALFDDDANAILGIDGVEESTILMAAVGIPV